MNSEQQFADGFARLAVGGAGLSMTSADLYSHLARVACGSPGLLSNAEACQLAGDLHAQIVDDNREICALRGRVSELTALLETADPLARILELETAGRAVVAAWEGGDLALAVRNLWLLLESED